MIYTGSAMALRSGYTLVSSSGERFDLPDILAGTELAEQASINIRWISFRQLRSYVVANMQYSVPDLALASG